MTPNAPAQGEVSSIRATLEELDAVNPERSASFQQQDVKVPEGSTARHLTPSAMIQSEISPAELNAQYRLLMSKLDGSTVDTASPEDVQSVQQMLHIITGEIEPRIKLESQQDQALVANSAQALSVLNSVTSEDAQQLREEISSHNKIFLALTDKAEAYSEARQEYEAYLMTQAQACCIREQKAVPRIVHTPAYVTCSLDQTEAALKSCVDSAVADMKLLVTSEMEPVAAEYQPANAECVLVTNQTATKKNLMSSLEQSCFSLHNQSIELYTQRLQDPSAFTKQYEAKYTEASEQLNVTQSQVKQREDDRLVEWDSIRQMNCSLNSFLTSSPCSEDSPAPKIIYPAVVLELKLESLPAVSSGHGDYQNKCTEVASEQAPYNCQVPKQDDPPSCSYGIQGVES
jgi:hypothetical protein